MPSPWRHPILGRPLRDYPACSRCEARITPAGELLVVKANGGKLIWMYCNTCEHALMQIVKPFVFEFEFD